MTQAELLRYVASVFEDLGITYMIGGSQASVYYGEARFTQDIDLVTDLRPEHLPALVHIRQDTSVGAVAEGWEPDAWQKVAREIAAAMAWSIPDVAPPGTPVPQKTAGWAV